MTVIFLNTDNSIHHIECDVGGLMPCYAVHRDFEDNIDRNPTSPGVYTRSNEYMDRLHIAILDRAELKGHQQ